MRLLRFLPAPALALTLGLAPAFLPSFRSTEAKTTIDALLAVAVHDTNTVRTLVHHDSSTLATPSSTIKQTAVGREDEVHNREEDLETVNLLLHSPKGTPQTIHYVADVIFVNGKTYYRIDPGSTSWKSQTGNNFKDPYTGGFTRARTKVKLPKGVKFVLVGVHGGITHVRASMVNKHGKSTLDLWLSGGKKPYVVRELATTSQPTSNPPVTSRYDTRFGPFNTNLVILPPTSSGA